MARWAKPLCSNCLYAVWVADTVGFERVYPCALKFFRLRRIPQPSPPQPQPATHRISGVVKGKGEVHHRTGHEGPERDKIYSSTLPSTSALDGVGW